MSRRGIGALVVLVLFGLAALTFALRQRGDHALVDFKVFYQAGDRFMKGEDLYRAADGHYQFKYLPASAVFFAPMALLPYPEARYLWALIVAGSLVGIIVLSRKLLPEDRGSRRWVVAVTVAAMLKYFLRELELGQANAVFGLLILFAVVFLRRDRECRAGALLGLAVAFKPYALVFIPYFIFKRKPRVWLTGIAVLTGAMLLPLFRYGFAPGLGLLGGWTRTLSGSTLHLLTNQDNVSLFGAFARWFGPDPTRTYVLALGAATVMALFLLWAMLRPAASETPGRMAWTSTLAECAALLLAIPLLSPQGWDYVFLLAAPAVMLLLDSWRKFSPAERVALATALAVEGLSIYDLLGRSLYRAFMQGSILTVCFVVLFVLLVLMRAGLQNS